MPTGAALSDTTLHPVYASKAALLADLEALQQRRDYSRSHFDEILRRLRNTNTSTFGDPTGRGNG